MLETAPHAAVTYTAKDARSIGEMFQRRVRESGPMPALYEKRNGAWNKTTWTGFYDDARRVLAGLLALDLKKGEKVAVLGETKRAWAVLDMGAQLGGFVSFGIYPKQTPSSRSAICSTTRTPRSSSSTSGRARDACSPRRRTLPELVAIVPWTDALASAYADRDPRVVSPVAFGWTRATRRAPPPAPAARRPRRA